MKELLELDAIERTSMACPALPLCGLAIGEAERTLPDCNRRIRALLDRLQFPHDFPLVVRVLSGVLASPQGRGESVAAAFRVCQRAWPGGNLPHSCTAAGGSPRTTRALPC